MARSHHDVPGDPSGIAGPHDILAAEEFPPPSAPDADTPQARARRLPPDPSGVDAPHDILAAEEYPPPAGADWSGTDSSGGGSAARWIVRGVLLLTVAGCVAAGLRRRR